VEKDPDRARLAEEDGCLVVVGEATEEAVLQKAGISRARGLATLISDDAENLYITVSSQAVRPDLPIIARAADARGARFLNQAGAAGVIRLDQLGAARIARSLMRPDVVMFLEEMIGAEREDTQLDSLRLPAGTKLAGRTLSDLDLRSRYSLQVLAIKRRGKYLANPGASEVLADGDILVVVGSPKGIASLCDVLEEEARAS
jgi:voltage-gated potassium channel